MCSCAFGVDGQYSNVFVPSAPSFKPFPWLAKVSYLIVLLIFYEPFWWWQIFICNYFFHFGGNLKNDFGKSGFIRLIATLESVDRWRTNLITISWVFLAELGDVFPLGEKTWKVGVSCLISYTDLHLLWLMVRSKVLDFRSKS